MSSTVDEGSVRPRTRRFRPSRDIPAGVAVAFVLIPQCLAYAELAGMPPSRGLLAAAIPPIVAAFFVSSPYLQTGPVALTSLLTLVALSGRADLSTDQYVVLGVLLAGIVGVVRVLISLLRAGRLAHVLSQPVLRGFVVGAALLILGSQLPSAMGVDVAGRGLVDGALYTLTSPSAWEGEALFLSLVTLLLILGGRRIHHRFPGVLVAMIFGLAYSAFQDYQGAVVGVIDKGHWGIPESLPWDAVAGLILPGLVIAIVAFSEALSISQSFAEEDGEAWDANQEFMSQGVANLASAAVGAFPVGGSFSRSSLSRLAGAYSRWCGGVTGLTVLLFLPFGGLLEQLPKAMLGATVIAAISTLLDPRPVWSLVKEGVGPGGVAVATLVGTLLVAPRIEFAVLGGAGLALLMDWSRRSEVIVEGRAADKLLRVQGYLCFLTVGRLEEGVYSALDGQDVSEEARASGSWGLDVSRLSGLDMTGKGLLEDVLQRLERQGIRLSQADTT